MTVLFERFVTLMFYCISWPSRYLKVLITRETRGHEGGRLEINEIQFFEGILAQTEYPRRDMKMKSPRTPSPQLVTCSSFTAQPTHCFRAFDGDSSSTSAWVTVPVGSDRKSLTPEQWVTFDFGAGLGIRPTSIRIVCGASDSTNARGCPMTFKLLGSDDNIRFSTLLSIDMYDYMGEYNSAEGLSFGLFWESPRGRENGHRCGSCDSGPDFVCSTTAFDSTCASRYCGVGGYCEKIPQCPIGWYLASSAAVGDTFLASDGIHAKAERDRMSLSCAPCRPGTYGDRPGLVHDNCTGICEKGTIKFSSQLHFEKTHIIGQAIFAVERPQALGSTLAAPPACIAPPAQVRSPLKSAPVRSVLVVCEIHQ